MVVTINLRELTGRRWTIDLSDTEYECITVEQLKEKIHFHRGIAEGLQRLVFYGPELKDSEQLCHTGVMDGSTIFIELKLRGGGPPREEDGGMGDKTGKNQSMEKLAIFESDDGIIVEIE